MLAEIVRKDPETLTAQDADWLEDWLNAQGAPVTVSDVLGHIMIRSMIEHTRQRVKRESDYIPRGRDL